MIFKMKARIKKTGEIINIASYAKVTLDLCDSYGNPMELGFDEVEILQEPTSDIDWEQRRYEIAKDMMAAFLSNYSDNIHSGNPDEQAKWAVVFADALIAELKKGGQQ